MAGVVEACIFCDTVHKGPCGGGTPKPAKKRAPKTPQPQGSLPEKVAPEPGRTGSGPAAGDHFENTAPDVAARWATTTPVDEVTAALGVLTGVLHEDEIEKHGLRRPLRPLVARRAQNWKEGRSG